MFLACEHLTSGRGQTVKQAVKRALGLPEASFLKALQYTDRFLFGYYFMTMVVLPACVPVSHACGETRRGWYITWAWL